MSNPSDRNPALPDPPDLGDVAANETDKGDESALDERVVEAIAMAIAAEDCDYTTFKACGIDCSCRAQARSIAERMAKGQRRLIRRLPQSPGRVAPTSRRGGKLDSVTDKESAACQPEDWSDWTYERRRIWRLEQQCLRWEALTFSARQMAYEQSLRVAELLGEEPSSMTEVSQKILDLFRDRFARSGLPENSQEARFKETAADVPGSDD